MLMDQGMGGEQFLSWSLPVHSDTETGTMEVPRILPSLSPIKEGIGMVASFSMDHEEVFIIAPMGILNNSLEMLCAGRDRI